MYDTVLLAVDESDLSARATTAAGDLARLSGGRVHVVHVREHQVVVAKGGGTFEIEDAGEAEALAARSVARLTELGVAADTEVVRAAVGHVAEEVVAAAGRVGADVIVLGSHGRAGVKALVLGSTAYKVIHLADRPVLVVR